MRLTIQEKNSIREALAVYVAKFKSQNKAASSLSGTSAGTISGIINGKYENISDDMFRMIGSQVGYIAGNRWTIVETGAFQEIMYALDDAQSYKNCTWVVGEAGCGKTTTAQAYAEENREVFYILCSEDMKKGDFVREIARKIGLKTDGHNIREIWSLILDDVIQMDAPLLIFDEADKLTEPVFHYFISLYNKLEDKAGVVFLSTDYICSRIRRGLQYNKPGYKEFYSRIGRKFFELEQTEAVDVHKICVANGITDEKGIANVIQEAEKFDFDLRRVKKTIHRIKRTKE